MIKKLSIIIPAYNEAKTIYQVLDIIHRLHLGHVIEKEIIVIDDCSSDGTLQEVNRFCAMNPNSGVIFIKQPINQGKGAALRKGIAQASGDFLIPQDADMELNPNEISLLLDKAMADNLQVVYGSRFLAPGYAHRNKSYYANKFLTWLSNLLSGLQITDMETCYKLIQTSLAQGIDLKENRFGFEPEITAKLAKTKNLRIAEVPISYTYRTHEEGKKINWKDGVKAIYCILKYNLTSRG